MAPVPSAYEPEHVTARPVNRSVRRQSGHFTRLVGDSSFGDYFDLFKFRSFEAKKFCHLDDLIRIYEIRGLSAEPIYTGVKLAALHCLRDVQTKAACTLCRVKEAKIANNHFFPPLFLDVVHNASVSYDPARAAQTEVVALMAEWLHCHLLVTNGHGSFVGHDRQIKRPSSVVL